MKKKSKYYVVWKGHKKGVYNSWEEWIGSPYFKEDGGLDTSSGKEGDWIKKSALHSTRFGENYLKQYLKNGPMRVKRYRK